MNNKENKWDTGSPDTIQESNEEKGLFGWIYANREKIIVDYFIKYVFAIGLTALYIAIAITFYDVAFKWLMDVSPEVEFAWKTFFFAVAAVFLAGGATLVIWFITMAYYLKFFAIFRKRMEFIDETRRLDE